MPDNPVIPIFPLSLVVLPTELTPLHIFEERYKAMIAYCRENDVSFGITPSDDGTVSQVGCTVEIARITHEYADGRMDILTVGRQRYRMIEAYQDLPYLTAAVEFFEDEEEAAAPGLLESAVERRSRFFELMGEPGWSLEEEKAPATSFGLVRGVQCSLEFKRELLESISENQRLTLLREHFDRLIPEMAEHRATVRHSRSNGRPKSL